MARPSTAPRADRTRRPPSCSAARCAHPDRPGSSATAARERDVIYCGRVTHSSAFAEGSRELRCRGCGELIWAAPPTQTRVDRGAVVMCMQCAPEETKHALVQTVGAMAVPVVFQCGECGDDREWATQAEVEAHIRREHPRTATTP